MQGPRRRARRSAPAGQRGARRLPDRWSGSERCSGCWQLVYLPVWIRRKRLPESAWFYRALVLAGPLSVVALIAGWVVTEVGRQPWVVYRVMPTAAAVTGAHGIPVGYGALAASYVAVGVRSGLGAAAPRARAARSGARLPSTAREPRERCS